MRLGHEEDDTNLTGVTAPGTLGSEKSPATNIQENILRQLNNMMPKTSKSREKDVTDDGGLKKDNIPDTSNVGEQKERKSKRKKSKSKEKHAGKDTGGENLETNSHANKENKELPVPVKAVKRQDKPKNVKRATSDGIIVIKDSEQSKKLNSKGIKAANSAKKSQSHGMQ